ncbi:MAG: hypothetical protein ACRES9_08630, partial [Gammaproteobacteria bacterium]
TWIAVITPQLAQGVVVGAAVNARAGAGGGADCTTQAPNKPIDPIATPPNSLLPYFAMSIMFLLISSL